MVESSTIPLRARLDGLAEFVPIFEDPDFEFAAMHGGDALGGGTIQTPYWSLAHQAGAFVRATYDLGWIVPGFDWSTWIQEPEASSLRNDRNAIAQATPEQIARLLTALIRRDRFADGTLFGAYQSGVLTRIVRRAAQLSAELDEPDLP